MPETTIDEYDRPVLRKDDVGRPGKPLVEQAEPESFAEEKSSDDQLRLRILRMDPCHDFTPFFRSDGIGHQRSSSFIRSIPRNEARCVVDRIDHRASRITAVGNLCIMDRSDTDIGLALQFVQDFSGVFRRCDQYIPITGFFPVLSLFFPR